MLSIGLGTRLSRLIGLLTRKTRMNRTDVRLMIDLTYRTNNVVVGQLKPLVDIVIVVVVNVVVVLDNEKDFDLNLAYCNVSTVVA